MERNMSGFTASVSEARPRRISTRRLGGAARSLLRRLLANARDRACRRSSTFPRVRQTHVSSEEPYPCCPTTYRSRSRRALEARSLPPERLGTPPLSCDAEVRSGELERQRRPDASGPKQSEQNCRQDDAEDRQASRSRATSSTPRTTPGEITPSTPHVKQHKAMSPARNNLPTRAAM